MSEDVLVVKSANGVALVTLNRDSARNALSLAVNRRLTDLAKELGNDSEVRVVIITGAGNTAFCAGADLKERKEVAAADSAPYIDAISGAIRAWAEMPKATIAAMNGSAYGGGLELALACDFRVAASGAEFGLTEVRLGILPGAGGTQRLPRLIGAARAKELIMLGRRISAHRALEIGMVHQVVDASELNSATQAWATEILRCAPISVAMAKQAIDLGPSMALADGLALERKLYEVTLFTEDRNEGLRAFAEKRPPRFQGK